MVASNGSNVEAPARRSRGYTSTLAYLRRIGTYLWIGLVNPGPPTDTPRRSRSRAA
jgi:hypothetical protein